MKSSGYLSHDQSEDAATADVSLGSVGAQSGAGDLGMARGQNLKDRDTIDLVWTTPKMDYQFLIAAKRSRIGALLCTGSASEA